MGALFRRAAACSAALLVCVLIAAGPARGAGWTDATTVGGESADVPVVAADATGDAAVAYQLGEAGVAGAVRPAGGVFTSPSPPLSVEGTIPAIAANATGGLVAGWAADDQVVYATGTTTAGFTGGGAIPSPGPVEVSAGVDDAGNYWLGWLGDDGVVRAFNPARGTVAVTSPSLSGIETVRMAVAPSGTVTFAWLRRSDGPERTRIERKTLAPASGVVLLEQGTLDSAGEGSELREPRIVSGSGAATIAWLRGDVDINDTPNNEDDDILTDNVRVSLDGAAPGPPLGTSSGDINSLDVDEASDGTTVVAWDESVEDTSAIRAAVRPAGAGFGAAEQVATGGELTGVSDVHAAIRAGGEPLVLWLRGIVSGELVNQLNAAVRPSSGWRGTAPPGDLGVESPTLAADGEGNVVAAWTAPAGGDRQARVAAYDGVGPRLTGLTIPTTGRPGDTLGFSAAATDSWSGIAGFHWTFGDGASADGANVEHAYASNGDYPAAVTVMDGEGNQSGDGSVLRISGDGSPPPPPPAAPKDTTAPVVSGLVVVPRCIAPGDVRSLIATFSVSEGAQMLYSIRRRKDSLVRRRCPGATTRKTPGTSEEAGSRQEQVVVGPNSATISGARRGAVHRRASRGRNRVRFSQVLTGLRPGTYQLIVRATDAAGNRSVDQIVKFWVLAPPRGG